MKLNPSLCLIYGLSVLGMLDALFLTVMYYNLAEIASPALVSIHTSKYATLFGAPMALLGLLYYVCVFGIINRVPRVSESSAKSCIYFVLFLSFIGFIFSVRLMWASVFVIESVCPYCATSAVITTVIFGLSFRESFKLWFGKKLVDAVS